MTTLQIVNEEGYKALRNLALAKPQTFINPQNHNLESLMIEEAGTQDVWKQTLNLEENLDSINAEKTAGPSSDAVHARTLRAALPQITAADAIDGNLWASINSFGLDRYIPTRWSTSNNKTGNPANFVRDHWIQYDRSDGRKWNAAARLWWMAELAERVSQYSEHDSDEIIDMMAENVNFYHQIIDRPYLAANPKLMAVLYDVFINGNQHLSMTKNINELLKSLNIRAAASALDLMDYDQLRNIVEEATPPKG